MTFCVVGIGASAGGLEAVSELLDALPAQTELAMIVVQHLDPRHDSMLPEILSKTAKVPVTAAVDGQVVKPNHVYIIPPNVTLTVTDERVHLTKRRPLERHLPIDALFTSLAQSYAERAIGVVLSGGDADGTIGIQAIKHEGGIVFAQDPDSARFPEMPRHAIASGYVDRVLGPRDIAQEIVRVRRLVSKAPAEPAATGDEALLRRLFQRIRAAHGLDFSHYKRSTLRRRLDRRMMLREIRTLEEYCDAVESDPAELAALHQDFLIRVTEFFRDPDSFAALRQVLPGLGEGRDTRQHLRIWVPGCATGEEVYSLAIEILESLGDQMASPRIQIFGTDVSEVALEKARNGVYAANVLNSVSSERLQRFFENHEDGFRIKKSVRDLCIFARQDVTHDPPFSRLDLISCRNLLIYLDDVAQRRIMQTFHFALRPHGILSIGTAETIGQTSELFEQVDKRFRIYRRRAGSGPGAALHPDQMQRPTPHPSSEGDLPIRGGEESLAREADRWLLARFAPASLLVDEELNIRQFRGRTGPFLEPASGPPSVDLQRVIRPELLVELLPAIREARESGLMVRRDAIRLHDEGDVSIEVVPLSSPAAGPGFLILFDDGSHPPRSSRATSVPDNLPESEKDRRLAQLQYEIDALRDFVRVSIEEHGVVQEELKSAHEEMLSAVEEYQSTNEELETSKEELQSTNEELTTTIEELRNRNRDLGAVNVLLEDARRTADLARTYADAIIEAVRAPLAVLDADLRIQRVNRAFITDMEVAPEKVERLFLDDADGAAWNLPGLRQKLSEVFHDGATVNDWQVAVQHPHRGRRTLMLTARRIPGDRERENLLLLAIQDVTDSVAIAADLLANNQRKDEFLAMLSHELRHPLTPITHAIYLLRLAATDPVTEELHETIETQTRRLARFVNELLDVVRLNRGFLEITREPLDLVERVRQNTAAMRQLAGEYRHEFTVATGDAPIFVDGDAGRLDQVVTNLLENAVKFTRPGGKITVTLEQRGDEALLSVRDNGIGIEPDRLTQIFEPFAHAESGLARSAAGGLGLGLTVVRHVLQLHGGRVEARSRGRDLGSEFVVRLPTIPPPAGRVVRPRDQGQTLAGTAPAARKKVLVVDDRPDVAKGLTRLLTAFGHEVAVATDGASALTTAATFQPDAAILDLSLPDKAGDDLARELRAAFPQRKLLLIAFTGHGTPGIQERCRAAGFDACMVKPGDPAVLEKLLQD